MAPWILTKLLHPFTPDDLLISQRIKSSLKLPPSTSQFVLALPTDPRQPEKLVYLVSVEKLSERSINDIHNLVAAVNPSSVVAFVDAQYLTEVVEEGNLLENPNGLSVPTSILDVIRNCFVERIKADVYESRARLKVLINLFGSTFYGNVFAAKKAAEEGKAVFEYLRLPSTATSYFSDEEEGDGEEVEVEGGEAEAEERICRGGFGGYLDSFLNGFSGLIGGGEAEGLNALPAQTVVKRLPRAASFRSEELAVLTPSVAALAPSVANKVVTGPGSPVTVLPPADASQNVGFPNGAEERCPSFAVPFYPLLDGLHQLFTQTPGVNQALGFSRKVLNSVERGEDVEHDDLARARLFRVAVESVRVCWNATIESERKARFRIDFNELPFEEKCQALLAHALQLQVQKFGKVVAVVDVSQVPGIRRHWNTLIPTEIAAYAEYCFVDLDSEEIAVEDKRSNLLRMSETKAAFLVSAGAVTAAVLGPLPQWVGVPAFLKVFSFKVPTVLKLVWMQMKRQAIMKWAAPAQNFVLSGLKGIPLASASPGAKAFLLKSVVGAEKVAAAAHSVVAGAEKASMHAVKAAFYSLMRNRQANIRGSGPWILFGGSVVAAGALLMYGDQVEHAIGIVPSAPAVVKLGRGLEKLDQASGVVDNREDSGWWNRIYEALYRNPYRM